MYPKRFGLTQRQPAAHSAPQHPGHATTAQAAPVPRRWVRLCAGAGLLALITACTPQITVHGYVPPAEEVDSLEPGVDTILSVEDRIGRPSSSGLLRSSDWYYIQTTMEQLTYNPSRATDRQVVAISFDPDGVVTSVQRYGLEDGRIVNLSPRVTETGGQRANTLRQIFAGLLNFNAADILGQ